MLLKFSLYIVSFFISRKQIFTYANRIGDEKIDKNKKYFYTEMFLAFIIGIIHICLFPEFDHGWFACVLEGTFLANSFLMVEMDIKYKQIYDLFHFINFACMILYIGYIGWPENYIPYLIFAGSQLLIFQFMYGQADALLYSECAAFMFIHNADLFTYFLFMGISILILGIVQAFRKNINKYGNLKIYDI